MASNKLSKVKIGESKYIIKIVKKRKNNIIHC